LKDGVEDIKNHRFFKSIDFNEIKSQKMKPPYVPKDSTDVTNKHLKEKGVGIDSMKEYAATPFVKKSEDIFEDWF
jgi:hypothetical protein